MADRIESFSFTVPANRPIGATFTQPMVFAQGIVREIDVKVPPGPAGNLGFRILAGGSQYIPRANGVYITSDDDYFTWPVHDAINSGSFLFNAFNTDIYPHLVQVIFQIDELQFVPAMLTPTPVSL